MKDEYLVIRLAHPDFDWWLMVWGDKQINPLEEYRIRMKMRHMMGFLSDSQLEVYLAVVDQLIEQPTNLRRLSFN